MTDGNRPHRFDQEPPETDRKRTGSGDAILIAAIVIAMIVAAAFAVIFGSNNGSVTNVPAAPPPSTQQPDVTAPANQNPAQ